MSKFYSCGEMSFCFAPSFSDENILNISQLISLQLPAGDGLRRAFVSRLVVGEIDEMVLCELRMKDDVHQTAASRGVMHFRHTADRLRIEFAVANEAHAAFEFVHEYASIRQEQERIRVLQPL